ncbi:hypothetical protein PL9631_560068 [Planktothrix paucivesiculata PCC 9631]|uniref:Uncharacterized protein n=1 Tax=Planktothrix paucivesiculata PCC 9631 TaxID=671071 RepID=A0A7Z9E0H4_9CYAN|nr:hypothetical protein PL9631_560068 [Planktothrix paucivesiculata PCC 9631]
MNKSIKKLLKLSNFGLTREQWIADFDCPSGKFIIEEIEKF